MDDEGPQAKARRIHAIMVAVEARRGPRSSRSIKAGASASHEALHFPGTLIDDRYILDRPLGKGGWGNVWLARDADGTSVALKVLRPEILTTPRLLQRFTREAELLSRLDHPRIAKAVGFGVTDTETYLAIEYVPGEPLSAELGRRARAGTPYALDAVLERLDAVAVALDYAHGRSVIHRDVKPQNVIVAPAKEGDPLPLKVLDFGIARFEVQDEGETTTLGRRVGSTYYMAPEQVLGDAVSPATDVFSLACVAFELLTLRRPWLLDEEGELVRAFVTAVPKIEENSVPMVLSRIVSGARPVLADYRSGVPEVASQVIIGALSRNPQARPASAPELVAELRSALAGVRGEDRLEPTQVQDASEDPAVAAVLAQVRLPVSERKLTPTAAWEAHED